MRSITSTTEIRTFLRDSSKTKDLGFVPTMGALHAGHVALIRRSVEENDQTVLSIFINPTQFNNPNDLSTYPSNRQKDLEIAKNAGVDVVFFPRYEELYKDQFTYQLQERRLSYELCGADRPGHFTGVLTVVMKLLNLIAPKRAYFGLKDFQQYELIKGMCDNFFVNVEICGVETVRDSAGLALSSRNELLDNRSKEIANKLNTTLSLPEEDKVIFSKLEELGFSVDYVHTRQSRRFAAVSLCSRGKNVRLIDNVILESRI